MCTVPNVIKIAIDNLLAQKDQVIIAIDGSCTAGKTTLAAALKQAYDCNVFHMDDFFLRPEQRTQERFSQAGGNVDYERFYEEVVLPLKTELPFSFRPFNCKNMELSEPVQVQPKKLTIVEGTYSHHPYFQNPYDLRIYLTVSPELRHSRILERPAFLHERFFNFWIPLEQEYFKTFSIEEHADLIL